MNIFLPQSIQTQIELKEIADVKRQIITPATSRTIIGIVQDGLLGSYNLTFPNMRIDWKNAMNIVSYTSVDDMKFFKKDKEYSGHELFSLIVPSKININREGLEIQNGILKKGHLSNDVLGSKKKNAIHQLIWDEYGADETKKFLDNTQRLINNFNLFNGFTVGIGDIDVSLNVEKQINNIFQTKEVKTSYLITEVENNPELMTEELFERNLFAELNVIRDDVSKLIKNNLKPNNNFNIMLSSGSKGKVENIGQMGGCIGLQAFEGKLIPKKVNKRTLPYFFQNDDRAESRGLIKHSFLTGMNYTEFFYHNMTGREGLIDQAIKSVTGETPIMIMEDNKVSCVQIGKWIDKQLEKSATEVEHHKERDMELLKLKHTVYIPTTNEVGNVSWEPITAITRHDPGKELYEIVTHGGRNVIVTESKSLLIWNKDSSKFERMSTPDVRVGDYVPVTATLAKPPTAIEYVDNEYMLNDKFTLNNENGVIVGVFLATGSVCHASGNLLYTPKSNDIMAFAGTWCKKHYLVNRFDKTSSQWVNPYGGGFDDMISILFNSELLNHGEVEIPEFTYSAPDEFIIGLLNGFVSENSVITDKSIELMCETLNIAYGLNILLSRLGIFAKIMNSLNDDEFIGNEKYHYNYSLSIRGQWAQLFKEKITLIDGKKMAKLQTMKCSDIHKNFTVQNDVVLDKIVSINKIDVKKYPKVYDLTIPKTLNFGLANGLHVVDTAESGYIQRKLIKSMEDAMIKYDGTVRGANNNIIQFVYGDTGADTTKQYEYNMKLMEMGNKEIKLKYKIKDEDLSKYDCGKEMNEKYVADILAMRNLLRHTQIKSRMNYITMSTIFMLPVNFTRIIDNVKNDKTLKGITKGDKLTAKYIVARLEEILSNNFTTLMCIKVIDVTNKESIKYQDEQTAKTSFKIALFDSLAPARCFYEYDLNKAQFDEIITQILESYNKNTAEAGEMVGIIAAQSMGEPVTQLNLNSFHHSGISAIANTTQGVPRIKELLSLSRNLKTPQMIIYLTKEYMGSREMANKVASHIKYTTLGHIRKDISVHYDPNPTRAGGYMELDNVKNVYYSHNPTKNSCQADINTLPMLMRIELDREKMLEKEVTMLEIKSKFCNSWEKRYADMKNIKKEERYILEKITQLAVLSNTDNDKVPMLHIRFDMSEYSLAEINNFIDYIVDPFKLKGIQQITDNGTIVNEERVLTFDGENEDIEKNKQYVIYTAGSNLYDIRYINGIDVYKTLCNDVVAIYETFGIEAARATLAREIIYAFERAGSTVNYHHLSVLVDLMASNGYLTSIDRHGMNKSDNDPLSRASFEKTVEQLMTAAVFSEVDHMKGVSSRIMAGLAIKGGTGLCDIVLDTDMLEKSEFTEDIGQKYEKTFVPIIQSNINEHIMKESGEEADIFIPQ